MFHETRLVVGARPFAHRAAQKLRRVREGKLCSIGVDSWHDVKRARIKRGRDERISAVFIDEFVNQI